MFRLSEIDITFSLFGVDTYMSLQGAKRERDAMPPLGSSRVAIILRPLAAVFKFVLVYDEHKK